MSRFAGRKHSTETVERMRAASTGRKHTPEAIEKIRAAHVGLKPSPETIAKRRASRTGVPVEHLDAYALYRRKGYSRAKALEALGLS